MKQVHRRLQCYEHSKRHVVYSGSEASTTVAPLGEAGTEEVTMLRAFKRHVVYNDSEAFTTEAPLGEAGTEEVTRL